MRVIAPDSYRDIEALLPIIYPKVSLSYGSIQKIAAPGIAAGVAKIFPNAEQRDDCFHVIYELNKVRSRLERQAYAAIQAEADSNKKLVRVLQSSDEEKRAKQMIVLLACLI